MRPDLRRPAARAAGRAAGPHEPRGRRPGTPARRPDRAPPRDRRIPRSPRRRPAGPRQRATARSNRGPRRPTRRAGKPADRLTHGAPELAARPRPRQPSTAVIDPGHPPSRPRQAMPTREHAKQPDHVQTAWPLTASTCSEPTSSHPSRCLRLPLEPLLDKIRTRATSVLGCADRHCACAARPSGRGHR